MKKTTTLIILYFICGLIWIYFSELLFASMTIPQTNGITIQLIKGSVFLFFTSLLIYYLIKHSFTLKKRDQQFQQIFEENSNPMWVFDEETLQILAVNDAAISAYGYNREEFLSMSIMKLRSEEKMKELSQVKASGGRKDSYRGRSLHKKKNGDLLHVDIFSLPTQYESRNARILTVIDVDEKHKSEQQMLQLSERLKKNYLDSLIDSQSNFLIRIDVQGNYTFVNKAFYNKFGYSEEELLGKSSLKTVIDQDHEKVLKAVVECVRHPGKVVPLKISKPNKKGEVFMTKWEFVGITNTEGEVVEIQGAGHDVTQEHKYYQELTRMNERLENILSSIHDIVWSARREDFSLLYINPACQSITGYWQQEFYQDNQLWINIIHPEDKERVRKEMGNLSPNQQREFKFRIIHKDSSVRHINRKVVLAKDEDGNPTMINGISSDITYARENARIREEILESITDGFFAVDKTWNFTYVNKEFERILKVKREDLLGENVWVHFPEAVNRKFYSEYHRAVRENISVRFEEYLPSLNLWFKVSAYPTQDGLAVYFQDVTKEKILELEIEKSEQNLTALINNTQDLIWGINADLKLLAFNLSYQQTIKAIIGRDIQRGDSVLLPTEFEKEVFEKWKAYYQKALAGKRFKVAEQFPIAGELMHSEISFNPIFSQGQLIGVSCFARDITESKKYENKLEQHNHILSEIAHIQSHNLRRPVATILGLVDLFDKSQLTHMNLLLVDKLEMVSKELDTVIHQIVKKTYELGS